jgi:pyridoxal phosphate enzyme (YggS family)
VNDGLAPGEAVERLARIEERIAAACGRSGRATSEVVLVGASKVHGIERIAPFVDAGLHVLGENRVQEAVAKRASLPPGIDWHLIGPLQTNKARPAVELFSTFHAIDRAKVALAIDSEASRAGRQVRGLLEVNLGGEATKHGFDPNGLVEACRPLAALEHLRIVGLMAIPPPVDEAEQARPWFRRLRELRDVLAGRPEWARFEGQLSMGMSDDFEVAIEEGATFIRLGTVLFGRRPKPTM